eukprot:gene26938-biopygen5935
MKLPVILASFEHVEAYAKQVNMDPANVALRFEDEEKWLVDVGMDCSVGGEGWYLFNCSTKKLNDENVLCFIDDKRKGWECKWLAKRKIKKGETLFFDYGQHYTKPWEEGL